MIERKPCVDAFNKFKIRKFGRILLLTGNNKSMNHYPDKKLNKNAENHVLLIDDIHQSHTIFHFHLFTLIFSTTEKIRRNLCIFLVS